MLLSGLSHACLCSDVHLICDKGWRTQHVPNRTCVIFNIIVFIAMVTPPKWIGFVLGAICLFIKYMPGWTTVKPQWPGWSSDVCAAVHRDSLAGCLYCQDSRTLGTSLFWCPLSLRRGNLLRPFTGSACMKSMLCCYWNEHQIVYIMAFYFCFWYRTQQFPFKKNLTRAHHCHDSWGISLSTVVIFRLLVVISIFIFKYTVWDT